MLQGLIYVSSPNPSLDRTDIESILSSARRKNTESDVTGVLLYCPKMFVQVLEGEPEALDKTLESITADDRHSDLTVLTRDPIDARVFSDWSMAFRDIGPDDSKRLEAEIGWDTARNQLNAVPNSHSMGLLVTSINQIVG